MKKNTILQIILLVFIVLVSFLFGSKVGYNIATKRIDSQYVIVSKDKLIIDVKAKLLVLKSLRTNDYAKATKALEDLVDADLASLSNFENDNKVLDKEVEKVAKSVILYRSEYNDHKINPGFEKSVRNLLNKYNK